jgi:hypothetical protein
MIGEKKYGIELPISKKNIKMMSLTSSPAEVDQT